MLDAVRRASAVAIVALALVGLGTIGLIGPAGAASAATAASAASAVQSPRQELPPPPPAYWIVSADGTVSPFGGAPFYGGANGAPLNKPIVGMTSTPDGHGYWLAATDGGIFSFGDGAFYGSTGALKLNKPVVGIASTATGKGYWLVASDGGIFSFGDAAFYGSTGAFKLNKPVVGMAPTPSGRGYWLVATDGGIFSLGDAGFYGSSGGVVLNKPIVQMASTATGRGYWLVASDGGIFTFGDAPFAGSLGSTPHRAPVVTMAATFNFGTYPQGARGYDVSFPDCGRVLPASADFAVVGVNNGHALSANPCLGDEWVWATEGGRFGSVYINVNSPGGDGSPLTPADPYQFGYQTALYSVRQATLNAVTATTWWLDVETANTWSSDNVANSQVIQGAVDALHAAGKTVGVYSTPYQWGIITAGYLINVPVWAAGAPSDNPTRYCSTAKSVGGGPVWLVQYTVDPWDYDVAC